MLALAQHQVIPMPMLACRHGQDRWPCWHAYHSWVVLQMRTVVLPSFMTWSV